MTNPDNALGTNGAFGGRTSVNAFNDVLATFDGAGIVSGFAVAPDTGMTVEVGGDGTTRDVAVAEDPFGNRTTVDNISGDPINVTINTASTTSARVDSIVAYVNSPANASDTSVDNPTACGIIAVNGTSGGAPLDAAIRTAITADGGTGSTAYYVVIANVSVPANTTTITSGLISAGKSINLSNVATTGSNGLMSGADKSKLDGLYLNNYSTTERVVGKWIDGRNIYAKTFEFTSLKAQANNSVNVGPHGITNFEKALRTETQYKLSWAQNNYFTSERLCASGICFHLEHTNIFLDCAGSTAWSGNYTLTVFYIKTSD